MFQKKIVKKFRIFWQKIAKKLKFVFLNSFFSLIFFSRGRFNEVVAQILMKFCRNFAANHNFIIDLENVEIF